MLSPRVTTNRVMPSAKATRASGEAKSASPVSWLTIFAGLATSLFVMGLVYGPLGSWLTGLFPVRVRYTGASVAFNVGGILGGAAAPIAAQALGDWRGTEVVGLYLALAGLVSFCGLALVAKIERGDA